MPKLTKRFVESEKQPSKGYTLTWDDEIAGFGLRVQSSGERSYFVQYRNAQGRSRRMTLGRHGKITADEARKTALRVFAAVRQAISDASSKPPGAVLEHVLSALRQAR